MAGKSADGKPKIHINVIFIKPKYYWLIVNTFVRRGYLVSKSLNKLMWLEAKMMIADVKLSISYSSCQIWEGKRKIPVTDHLKTNMATIFIYLGRKRLSLKK